MSQCMLKEHAKILELASEQSSPWTWYIQGVLNLNLGHIVALVKQSSSEPIAPSLRLLETFTSYEIAEKMLGSEKANNLMSKTFSYLIAKGYFKTLRFLFDQKTPVLLGSSAKPPNPLIGCLFDLLSRPLLFHVSMSKNDVG